VSPAAPGPGSLAAVLRETAEGRLPASEGRRRVAEIFGWPAPAGTPGPQEPGEPVTGEAEAYPLSRGQAALWAMHQADPGTTAYNLPLGLWLADAVDDRVLEQAVAATIRRHPQVRIRVRAAGPAGDPVQEVTRRGTEIGRAVLDHLTEAELRIRIHALVHEPFDLEHDPLYRVWVVTAQGGKRLLLLVFHHLITDGVSSHLLLRDIVHCYQALRAGRSPSPLAPAAGYREFVEAQLAMPVEDHRAYWLSRLAGASTAGLLDGLSDRTELVADEVTASTGDVQFRLTAAEWAGVRSTAARSAVTPFGVVLGAFAILLARHAGQRDISVMVPTDGRPAARFDETVGYLINPVVIRLDCAPDRPAEDVFRAVRAELAAAEDHSTYPFARVVDDLRSHAPAGTGGGIGFGIGFYLQHGVGADQDMDSGQPLFQDALEITQEGENDLVMEIVVRDGHALVHLKYDERRLSRPAVERLAEHYRLLLSAVTQDAGRELGRIELTGDVERARLDRVNGTGRARPRDTSAAALVLAQAARTPERIAVITERTRLSYADLVRRVGALAQALREHGVGPGHTVALLLSRDVDLVAAPLAVMTTGAAYLPVDPQAPAERTAYVLADAGVEVLIADVEGGPGLARIDPTSVGTDPGAVPPPLKPVSDDDPAYVLYTSGSTGRPKGVVVSHGNLVNLLSATARTPGCDPDDVLLAVTTAGFDIAGLELLLPLTVGAGVRIAPDGTVRDGAALAELIVSSGATMMQATPATWRMLVTAGWRGRLSRLLCGGEALDPRLAAALLERADEVWNMYGPTETTIWSSAARIRPGRPVTVGRPLDNTRFELRDEADGPVPFGAVGELWIGGDGVALEYRGKPELTSERFVGGWFRTGDLGRWGDNGELTLLGRADRQIKLRGYRIELGEVEEAVRRTGLAEEVRVVSRDLGGTAALVAFAVAGPAAAAEVMGRLAAWLPAYMIPSRVVALKALPQTPNAKIDLRPLVTRPIAEIEAEFGADGHPVAVVAAERAPGLTADLRDLVAEMVGRPAASVPLDRPLGEVGFDSVRFTRLAVALRERYQVRIAANAFYSYPSLTSLSDHLRVTHPSRFPDQAGPAVGEAGSGGTRASTARLREPGPPAPGAGAAAVAIIGVGVRLPESSSLKEFWGHLENGHNTTRPYPLERGFSRTLFPEAYPGSYVRDVEAFDPSRFRISPREAAQMDPQQRLLLHCADEAFQVAGYPASALAGSDTGVFVGLSGADYLSLLEPGSPEMGDHFLLGNVASIAANRISYVFDLHGPSAVFDTACSSSLVALHRAARSILAGECRLALAGGANLLLAPHGFGGLRRAGMLSPDGRCKTFDEAADGYGRGEGVVLFLLKRLDAARADGDPILGRLIGSAENHGGQTHSLTVPNPVAQREVVLAAHRAGDCDPGTVTYLEAHGTGTRLGDPIEIDALTAAFGRLQEDWGVTLPSGHIGIGSVKSNIGHLEAAAGAAGVVKVLLAMRHRKLPGLATFRSPNPMIDLSGTPFRFVTRTEDWDPGPGGVRRAGVSSFGMGGSNVHVVLEEAGSDD